MVDNELISIIMAAYNAEKTIENAIKSVVGQKYDNWELIIVNDCSTDNTIDVIKKFDDDRITVINNTVNSGVSVSRHNGFKIANGNWIAILDSDDAWTNDKLYKQMELYKKNGGQLIFTGSTFMNEKGEAISWNLQVPDTINYKKLLKQNIISNSSVLVRKELLLKNEVIEDNMHEDFACWLNILKSGNIAYGINEPLLIYRISKSSKSGNKIKAAKMNWNTYRYIGLNIFKSIYYMIWYTYNGLKKYKNLK